MAIDLNLIRIPVIGADAVYLCLAPLPRTGEFCPTQEVSLTRDACPPGVWWQVDLSHLGLDDGAYEYNFRIVRPGRPDEFVPDPYAEEITRFNRYRGVLRMADGHRTRLPFDWTGELPGSGLLPANNSLVICELPMRWVDSSPDAVQRQVGIGTFDKAIFVRLDYWQKRLGVNAIELLPVQDSTDTLNWGYGTRFFFAPDLDMGHPTDLKLFIKRCHQAGIRVILDVVMNHSKECPLETLASDMFYLREDSEEKLPDNSTRIMWGGKLFRYATRAYGDFHARNFHCDIARYWIEEYHVDGFRIDEFRSLNNWDFIRQFRDHAWQVQQAAFPDRPFIVIAEDSGRHAEITQDDTGGGTKVVDAMWDFDYRDEVRRLAANGIITQYGQASRSERVRALIRGDRLWNDWTKDWRPHGFTGLAQRIIYNTSHDVQGQIEQRLIPYFVELGNGNWTAWDQADASLGTPAFLIEAAFSQAHATFALLLTAPGIPMFLAGEEFGDLHDLPHHDDRYKMSDPVDWARADHPMHRELLARVEDLVQLRRGNPSLRQNEITFFGLNSGFHPRFDENDGPRVFAYCRTGGQPLGTAGQVIVVANCGADDFPQFILDWPWAGAAEVGGKKQPSPAHGGGRADLALEPFQVRVFVG